MGDNIVHDFSGDDEDFLSEEELEFLEDSSPKYILDSEEEINIELKNFSEAYHSGLSLSNSLERKIKRLIKKSHVLDDEEEEKVRKKFLDLSNKMVVCNKKISELIRIIYEFCEANDKFWCYSSVDVYKSNYSVLKVIFSEKYPISNELDFLKSEYQYFYLNKENKVNVVHKEITNKYLNGFLYFNSKLDFENDMFFSLVNQRKIDFIAEEIKSHGFQIEALQDGDEIKINLIPIVESFIDNDEDTSLNLSQLPSYSLAERYEILVQLGIENIISKLDTSKNSKNMLLGLIMGVSVENAKKLLNGTYKLNPDKEKAKIKKAEITNEIKDFMERNKIKLNK
ncbi:MULTISPECIES: hypothetical protein [Flavobacterium]|uniref:Uncharacterized protein n=1 Tax=Flavobacterium hankyongi TaxID=1176532 RepID=A0ABP9A953_9FLAO|nr:hypothetical protein [Flavobacterium sp. N1846]